MKLARAQRLVLATHNAGKLTEFRELLADFGFEIISAGELGLPEPDETGTSFAENARIKAHAAARASGEIALSDDSGLCVDALDGAPGVYTAGWAGTPRDFTRAMERVERELQDRGARQEADRRASFHAVLCLARPDGSDTLFEGRVDGVLVWPPRGERGHGYDPIFRPQGHDRTFGEMSAEEKHSWTPGEEGLSHRARAFAKFVEAVS